MAITPGGRFKTSIPTLAPDGPGGGGSSPNKRRILIVEDDYLVATELEFALSGAGFEVVGTAATAAEALDIASAARPDLAIVDVRLRGDDDGVNVAKRIFNDLGIRSIFATAHADDSTKSRALEAKPIAWIQKPYRPAELVSAVDTALSL